MRLTEAELNYKKPMNVLIVDDDPDAASLVVSIFKQLGCETTYSLTSDEAQKKICAGEADIIILDWLLDEGASAHTVTDNCTDLFSKFGLQLTYDERPKIVTYSSLESSKINLLTNPYFLHLEHWQKPISQQDLLSRASELLQKVRS
jgi:CheY-like chemotaxis protein